MARWGKRSAIKLLETNTWAHVKQSQICNVETPGPRLRRWFWKCVYKSFQSRCDGLNRGTAPRIGAKLVPGSKWDYICLLFDSEWPLEKQGMILLSYFAATSKNLQYSVPFCLGFSAQTWAGRGDWLSPALWLQSRQIKGWLVDNICFFSKYASPIIFHS